MAAEFASGAKVSTPLDVQGDDDDAAHLDTLDDAAERIKKAWRKAQDLDEEAKRRFQEKARGALDTAKGLADGVIRHLPHTIAAQELSERAQQVKQKLTDTAKTVLPWYLAIGAATWIGIGVVAWLVLRENAKQRPERERIARKYIGE